MRHLMGWISEEVCTEKYLLNTACVLFYHFICFIYLFIYLFVYWLEYPAPLGVAS